MEYINSLHYKVIFSLIDAANFLGIESLLSLALAWVAFVLKGERRGRGAQTDRRGLTTRMMRNGWWWSQARPWRSSRSCSPSTTTSHQR